MSSNLDLCELLGLPEVVVCPNCQKDVFTNFFDYPDVYNPSPGRLELDLQCGECEHSWCWKIKLVIVTES